MKTVGIINTQRLKLCEDTNKRKQRRSSIQKDCEMEVKETQRKPKINGEDRVIRSI